MLQFNGNVFRSAGHSGFNLSGVEGGSAIVDVGAGTLVIAGSPANRISGFDVLDGTHQGGDRFIDGPGSQEYDGAAYAQSGGTFAFHPGHGADTVVAVFADGESPALFSTIELDGFGAAFSTFAQVVVAAVDTGADTRIATPDGGSILVVGYHAADLTAAEFRFG